MLDLTWKLFCMTGNVNSYLLLKQLEQENKGEEEIPNADAAEENETAH